MPTTHLSRSESDSDWAWIDSHASLLQRLHFAVATPSVMWSTSLPDCPFWAADDYHNILRR